MTETNTPGRSGPANPPPPQSRMAQRKWLPWVGALVLIVVAALIVLVLGDHPRRQIVEENPADRAADIQDLQSRLSTAISTQLGKVQTQISEIDSVLKLPPGQTKQIGGLQDQLSNVQNDLSNLTSQIQGVQEALDAIKPSRQKERIEQLENQLRSVTAQLDLITDPSKTIDISTNDSKYFAGGALIIGLIGSPRQENVQLNISGTGNSIKSKQQTATAGDVIDFAPDTSTACRIKVLSFDILRASVTVNAACTAAKS
jgi:septal ring factor EnvC (AmiA/AmiB activator)